MESKEVNRSTIGKKLAGEAAAHLIKDGMLVGLGTGSTAVFFIEALGKRCQEGLNIFAVATSERSGLQAKQLGIPILNPQHISSLDVTVDGADEIDNDKNMIKGGGGALLREKLLAKASKEMIVIVDESKCVTHLGRHPLPVEIIPFACCSTIFRLQEKHYQGSLRLNQDNTPFVTDNGNYIFDIQYSEPILNPETEHDRLKSITGIVETGFFFQIAKKVIIGYENGEVVIRDHVNLKTVSKDSNVDPCMNDQKPQDL
ncbi:MAG: ribose-5-phosphate isomerase RpiA [Parachlamydiaceae bacterium]